MHRTEEPGGPEMDSPPALPAGVAGDEDVQRQEDGTGPRSEAATAS